MNCILLRRRIIHSAACDVHIKKVLRRIATRKQIFKMTGTEEVGNRDATSILPDEILLFVFQLLPLDTLLQCENVCQRWKKLSRDPTIWRHIVIVYSGKPGQTEVSERNLEILKSHSDYIYCVKLQYVYNYSFIKSMLERCYNLTSIELVMCRISSEFVFDIQRWPLLKKLSLKNSISLQTKDNDTEMLLDFNNLRDLTYLALADFGLSTINFESLINCTHLSHIFIEKIKDLNVDDIKKLILSKQKSLISFHVYGGAAIDDKCLNLLAQCAMLVDLAIIRCESLTDVGLLPLASLRHIQHLQIWNNVNFTEMALLSTLSSPNLIKLESLSLSRIRNITPVIVDLISEYYKNLKFLAMYQCPKIINTDYEKQLKSKFRNIDVVLY